MYKYKKITINFITTIYILLTILEVILYLFAKNNLFGLIYIIINLFIIFLLVPISYNYNKYFSSVRLSKLIITFLLIIFTSFILHIIVLKNMGYVDSSNLYIKKIFVTKNILKPIIDFIILIFILLEFKLDKLLMKNKKHDK
jgi:c-di-AMP phosphodiesterase-like protein